MKKVISGILIVIFIVVYLMVNSVGNSFSWSWFSSFGNEKVKTEQAMTVPMYGNDGRLYPFEYKNKECIALSTTEAVGLHCWDKVDETK